MRALPHRPDVSLISLDAHRFRIARQEIMRGAHLWSVSPLAGGVPQMQSKLTLFYGGTCNVAGNHVHHYLDNPVEGIRMANLQVPHICYDAAGAIGGRTSGENPEMDQVREGAGPASDIDFSEDDDPPFISHQIVELTRLVLVGRCYNKRVTIVVPAVLVDTDADGECGHRM
jgi:hypothetical protein